MYIEGEVPNVVTSNGYNNGNNGWNDWSWIIGLAVVGGIFGNGGFGFGGGNRNNCCGTPATQADLANGFAQNTIQRGIDDIILGQAQAINYNNQGFAGLQNTLTTSFANLNTNLCSLGYNQAQLVNGLSRELSDCCCKTNLAIQDVKYANERQTCDLITNANQNTQRIIDFMVGEKLASKDARIATLEAQISNDRQSKYLIDVLGPKCPQPAYVVQPAQPVTFPTNCCGNVAYANFGGCGASVL